MQTILGPVRYLACASVFESSLAPACRPFWRLPSGPFDTQWIPS